MSRPNIAAPGEAFSTVWYVERIAHAALSMKVSMSAGSTDLAMSISEVRVISRLTMVLAGSLSHLKMARLAKS
jgi:hypothetical protein